MGNALPLHKACNDGNLEKVMELLTTNETLIHSMDENSRTPLHYACIIENNRLKPQQQKPSSRQESIEESEFDTNIEIIKVLKEKGVKLDAMDERGWTALHYACAIQNIEIINYLLTIEAKVLRDAYGILPQDLLLLKETKKLRKDEQQALEHVKKRLCEKTEEEYAIRVYCLRSSGICELDFGTEVSCESSVTVEYTVPENHSTKDFIQVLIYDRNQNPRLLSKPEFGCHQYVPAGKKGSLTFKLQSLPLSSLCRFVYVKADINQMDRHIVASGGTISIVHKVVESIQYDLYLHDRVIEIESAPHIDPAIGNVIVMKRIGVVISESEVEWADLSPGNYIIAVDDEHVSVDDFEYALSLLQNHRPEESTKLTMQNHNVVGDFIPEKVIGAGIIGKFASLQTPEGTLLKSKESGETSENVDSTEDENVETNSIVKEIPSKPTTEEQEEITPEEIKFLEDDTPVDFSEGDPKKVEEIVTTSKPIESGDVVSSTDIRNDGMASKDHKNEVQKEATAENVEVIPLSVLSLEKTNDDMRRSHSNSEHEAVRPLPHDDIRHKVVDTLSRHDSIQKHRSSSGASLYSCGSDDEAFQDAVSGREQVHVVLTSMKDLPKGEQLMNDMLTGVHSSISAITQR